MSWHTPERKTEQALLDYLSAVEGNEFAGVQFLTRFSNAEKTEPRIEIVVEKARPDISDAQIHTGNWVCEATMKVISHYESEVDAETHDEIVGQLLDKLLISDAGADAAAEQINATQTDENFTCFDVRIGDRTNSVDEHSVITEQSIEIDMKPSR